MTASGFHTVSVDRGDASQTVLPGCFKLPQAGFRTRKGPAMCQPRVLTGGVLLLTVVLLGCAEAEPQAAADYALPPATTTLHLSATGSVQVSPDQLVAKLVAQATSPAAATAQRRVNEMVAAGMKKARGVTGVETRAIGYSVSPTADKRPIWTAQQTLELRGSDGPTLLDLAWMLQQQDLVAASVEWQLPPAVRRKAHDEATTAALKELQERAASAAEALSLHVRFMRDVRLDEPDFVTHRPFRAMGFAARAMAAPPQATATPEDVTAQTGADVVLRPRL